MKKNRVNQLLNNQARRKKILNFAFIIIVVTVILFALLPVCISRNKKQYVNYNETSKADYKVYLKENEFYDNNYLEKDNQYIASLIDYITADFNYKLSIDEKNINYKYTYRIEAEVNVEEKDNNNSIYNYKETLVEEKTFEQSSNSNVEINEQVNIDYNTYNNRIKKFISVYDLDNTESTLKVNMHINVIGSCEKFENNTNDDYVVSLTIPLTTKTVAIDIDSDVVTSKDNLMLCKKTENCFIITMIMIIAAIIDVIVIVEMIIYIFTTRTAETIYDRELKKILNNYKSYIQKVNNEMELEGYQKLEVDTFTDMLEIRDTIQEPILMMQSLEEDETYFMIPSKTNLLYIYELKVSDIKVRTKKGNRFAL